MAETTEDQRAGARADLIADLRKGAARELNDRQWDGVAYAAHGRHKPHRYATCPICQGDVRRIADVAMDAAKPVVAELVEARAEVERLRAELDQTRMALEGVQGMALTMEAERDDARTEAGQLRAELAERQRLSTSPARDDLTGLETRCALLHGADETDPAVKDLAWRAFALIRGYREQRGEVERLEAVRDKERDDSSEMLQERDDLEVLLDKFAGLVAPVEVIGEHSSGNDPWANAMELVTAAAEVEALRAELARWEGHDALTMTLVQQVEAERDEARAKGARYITRIHELVRKNRVLSGVNETLTEQRNRNRAEGARLLEHLRLAHPRHFTPNVIGQRLCGCDGEWPCREHVALAEQVQRVRALHGRPRTDRHGAGCIQCGIVWPCPTFLAVNGEEAADTETRVEQAKELLNGKSDEAASDV